MPNAHHRRRRQALLRGGRQRHAGRVRARVRRRPPQLGAAGAPLLAPLPLHRLQRARLSAVRRARGLRALLAGARARRYPLRARCARHRQARARRRAVDGRLRHAALRHDLRQPRGLSITVAGGGYGSHPAQYRQFQADSKKNAERDQARGAWRISSLPTAGPQRVQLEIKDPRAFAEYLRQFKEHSALGAANTLLGVQAGGRRSTT